MADARAKPGGEAPKSGEAPAGAAGAAPAARPTWRDVWQIPAMLVAVAALAGGVIAVAALRPKPDFGAAIRRAEALVAEQKYEEGLKGLNKDIHPYLDKGVVPADLRRQFHTLVARSIYLWQESESEKRPENYMNVVGEYLEAESADGALRAPDAAYLADAYISLGKLDDATERMKRLGDTPPEVRYGLLHRLIESCIKAGKSEEERAAELLASMLAEPDLTREQRIWATARQAETMMAAGAVEETIARLLRTLPRLATAGGAGLGELYLYLGEAYLRSGASAEAETQLRRASELLGEQSPAMGRAQLLLGRLAAHARNYDAARERFASVLERFAGLPVAGAALLGMGEVDAARGDIKESLGWFETLVKETREGARNPDAPPEQITRSLVALAQDRFAASDWENALKYGSLAEEIPGRDAAPLELVELLGQVNLKLAEEAGGGVAGGKPEARTSAAILAQRKFLDAAESFRSYATRTVLSSGRKHADALWAAADAFDRAGDRDGAITSFQEFVDGFPQDPRRPEAQFRLARAFQARGQFPKAAELFTGLIAERGPEGAGRYADDSYVPLARNYLLDNDPSNDPKAEELLNTAVSGELGGPQSENYREALVALADYYYDRARTAGEGAARGDAGTGRDVSEMFSQAIARYDEALTRFPAMKRSEVLSYKLADSCRLAAGVISSRLKEAMLDAQRRDMERARVELLRRAQATFERSRRALEARDAASRTALEDLCLRNSYFYVGDCAFELEDYAAAIAAYDAARERYAGDPATLVALVQIVNAYMRRGDTKAAAAANEHARRFFAGLPESVWNDPNLPMSRKDWERWLEVTSELGRVADAGGGAKSEGER